MKTDYAHHQGCPADRDETNACRCEDPDLYRGTEFTAEDVEHLDDMIARMKADSPGLLALPGAEWVRNMVAARAGVAPRPLGWDAREGWRG